MNISVGSFFMLALKYQTSGSREDTAVSVRRRSPDRTFGNGIPRQKKFALALRCGMRDRPWFVRFPFPTAAIVNSQILFPLAKFLLG
jgi:hypothetical protein